MSIRDDIRDLMARYPAREPTPAEQAAGMLRDLGFTAGDILDGLAAGGTISVLPMGYSADRAMDLAGFTPAERDAFRAAAGIPDDLLTSAQRDLEIRYERARNELMYGEEGS